MNKLVKILLLVGLLLTLTSCSNKQAELDEEAYNYYLEEDYNTAVEKYTEAIERYPEYVSFYINRGITYLEIRENDLAMVDLEKAVELDDDNPKAYATRGYGNMALGYYNSALEDFDRALSLIDKFESEDDIYTLYLNLGTVYNIKGDDDYSLEWYDKALEISSDDEGLINAKGMVLKELERYDEALECFNMAIDMNQFFSYAYANRAAVFFVLGDKEIALADVNTAITLDSYVPQFYNIKGQILSELGESDKAIDAYTAAININAAYPEAYLNRASEYIKQERFPDALIDYSIVKEYGYVEVYKAIGSLYREIGQYEDALENLYAYIDQVGDDVDTYLEIGRTYQLMGRFEESLAVFNGIVSIYEDNIDAYILMGIAYENLEDYEKGIESFEKVLEIDPENVQAIEEIDYINNNFM